MSSVKEEVGFTSSFAGSVSSEERELAIDEDDAASSSVLNLPFGPDSNVVLREVEECVRRPLEEVASSDGRAKETSEGDSFVDIIGSLERETVGEWERFRLADILQRTDLLS